MISRKRGLKRTRLCLSKDYISLLKLNFAKETPMKNILPWNRKRAIWSNKKGITTVIISDHGTKTFSK